MPMVVLSKEASEEFLNQTLGQTYNRSQDASDDSWKGKALIYKYVKFEDIRLRELSRLARGRWRPKYIPLLKQMMDAQDRLRANPNDESLARAMMKSVDEMRGLVDVVRIEEGDSDATRTG